MTATSRVGKTGECCGGMPTPRLAYEHLKEIDEALQGALVLADLKVHENRAPPACSPTRAPTADTTESRVLEALVVEARRLQAAATASRLAAVTHRAQCASCPNTPPPSATVRTRRRLATIWCLPIKSEQWKSCATHAVRILRVHDRRSQFVDVIYFKVAL